MSAGRSLTAVERIEWRLRHDVVPEEAWRADTVARAVRAKRTATPRRSSPDGHFFERPIPTVRPRLHLAPSLSTLFLLVAILGGVLVVSPWSSPPGPTPSLPSSPYPTPTANPTLLRIQASGQLRVAVVGGTALSIHGAVAGAVARGLGVEPVLTEVPREVIRADGWNDRWDVAVGIVKGFSIGENQAFVGEYGYRAAYLLVQLGSSISSPADLAGHSICAREGGDPLNWITGFHDADSATTPVALPDRDALTIVTRPSDQACVDELDAGTVDAVFEDELLGTELPSPRERILGGPVITERLEFLVSRQDPYAADLRFPIGDVLIHGLWVDGTLADLFSHHQNDNVQAIEPTQSPAPS